MIARGSQENLISGLPGELRLRFAGTGPGFELPAAIRARAATVDGELRISRADTPGDLAALLTAGCSPNSVDVRRPDLDDLYRSLAEEAPDAA